MEVGVVVELVTDEIKVGLGIGERVGGAGSVFKIGAGEGDSALGVVVSGNTEGFLSRGWQALSKNKQARKSVCFIVVYKESAQRWASGAPRSEHSERSGVACKPCWAAWWLMGSCWSFS